jgi:hypothetical protein
MNRLFGKTIVGLAASLAMATAADAAAVFYTISGQASGSLGGQAFSDAAFEILLTGDTATLLDFGFGAPAITPLSSVTVRIAGFGDASLTEATRFGINRNVNIFFLARDFGGFGGDLFDFHVTDAQETAFVFTGAYGPVGGTDPFVDQFDDVATSQGALTLEAASGVTFFGAAVPEPGAWAMMIVGFGGVGALVRRRRPAPAV